MTSGYSAASSGVLTGLSGGSLKYGSGSMPTLLYMLQKNSTRPESVLKPGLPSKRSLPVLYL